MAAYKRRTLWYIHSNMIEKQMTELFILFYVDEQD